MTMPAGEYWIGDLCYVMHEAWDEFCEKIEQGGEYTLKDGRRYAWQNTEWGDGEYQDQYGNSYGVDAGLIGCIKLSDINRDVTNNWGGTNDVKLGHVYTFHTTFEVTFNNGVIKIGHIEIDTDPPYEEEDEEWNE